MWDLGRGFAIGAIWVVGNGGLEEWKDVIILYGDWGFLRYRR